MKHGGGRMRSVLSHIVHKQFSSQYENIATEALSYILESSELARNGLIKALRGIVPEIPILRFQTQYTEDNMRPDMWGVDAGKLRVFIENKFWAGLTENQPVEYLKLLDSNSKEGILLVIVPSARQESIWRELTLRLKEASISYTEQSSLADIPRLVKSETGTFLALTTWTKIIALLESEVADELQTRNDLTQLKTLCDIAESDAFVPLSSFELTNQRIPAIISQAYNISQKAVDYCVSDGFIYTKGLNVSCTSERVGRYFAFVTDKEHGIYAWIGVHFAFWKKYGETPLWLFFYNSNWGSINKAQSILEHWAEREGYFTAIEDNNFIISIKIPRGEELDNAVRSVRDQLQAIAKHIEDLV